MRVFSRKFNVIISLLLILCLSFSPFVHNFTQVKAATTTITGTNFVFNSNGSLTLDGASTSYGANTILKSNGAMNVTLNNTSTVNVLAIDVPTNAVLTFKGVDSAVLLVNASNDPTIATGVNAGSIVTNTLLGYNFTIKANGKNIGMAANMGSGDSQNSFNLRGGKLYGTGSLYGMFANGTIEGRNIPEFHGDATSNVDNAVGIYAKTGQVRFYQDISNPVFEMNIEGNASGKNSIGISTANATDAALYNIYTYTLFAANKINLKGTANGDNSVGLYASKSLWTDGVGTSTITGIANGTKSIGGRCGQNQTNQNLQEVWANSPNAVIDCTATGTGSIGLIVATKVTAQGVGSKINASGDAGGIKVATKFPSFFIKSLGQNSTITAAATGSGYGIETFNGAYVQAEGINSKIISNGVAGGIKADNYITATATDSSITATATTGNAITSNSYIRASGATSQISGTSMGNYGVLSSTTVEALGTNSSVTGTGSLIGVYGTTGIISTGLNSQINGSTSTVSSASAGVKSENNFWNVLSNSVITENYTSPTILLNNKSTKNPPFINIKDYSNYTFTNGVIGVSSSGIQNSTLLNNTSVTGTRTGAFAGENIPLVNGTTHIVNFNATGTLTYDFDATIDATESNGAISALSSGATITTPIQVVNATPITLNAVPDAGYQIKWVQSASDAVQVVNAGNESLNQLTFNMPLSDINIVAHFVPNSYDFDVTGIKPASAGASTNFSVLASATKSGTTTSTGGTKSAILPIEFGDSVNLTDYAIALFSMPAFAQDETTSGGSLVVTPPNDIGFSPSSIQIGYHLAGWIVNKDQSNTLADAIASSATVNGQTFSLPFTMPNNDVSVSAVFLDDAGTLSVISNDTNMGTVLTKENGISIPNAEDGFTAISNSAINLVPQPVLGYAFKSWKVIFDSSSSFSIADPTANPLNFTMPGAGAIISIEALFEPTEGILTVQANNASMGTVSTTLTSDGSTAPSSISYLTSIDVLATPDYGYKFTGWTDALGVLTDASSNSNTFNMPIGDVDLTANFAPINKTVNVSSQDVSQGTITLNSSTGATQNSNFDYNTTFTVTANPVAGYEFDKWIVTDDSGTIIAGFDTANSASQTVSMPINDVTFVASFIPSVQTLTVTCNDDTMGNVSYPLLVKTGDLVTVTATPVSGYRFIGWSVNFGNVSLGSTATESFIMPGNSVSITANFELIPIPTYNITAKTQTNDNTQGSIKIDSGSTTNTTTITTTAKTTHTVTAIPASNYKFIGWTVTDLSGTIQTNDLTGNLIFSMPANDVQIVAKFAPVNSNLTIKTYTDDTTVGSVSLDGGTKEGIIVTNANQGTQHTIVAMPSTGYKFTSWTIVDESNSIPITDTTGILTFTMPATPVTITANFEIIQNSITVKTATNTSNEGEISLDGSPNSKNTTITANANSSHTVVAIPANGYRFEGWTIEDESKLVPIGITNDIFTFTMPANEIVITANFVPVNSNVIIKTSTNDMSEGVVNFDNGNDMGLVSTNATFGTSHTVVATPAYGFKFIDWSIIDDSGTIATGDKTGTLTFTMPSSSVTIVANFAPTVNNLVVKTASSGTTKGFVSFGSVSGAGVLSSESVTGSTNNVIATPLNGYKFIGWAVSDDSNTVSNEDLTGSFDFEMPDNPLVVTAFFAPVDHNLISYTYTKDNTQGNISFDNGTSVAVYTDKIPFGTTHTVSASPETGYRFDHWVIVDPTNTVSTSDTSGSFSFTLPNNDVYIIAKFAPLDYRLNVSANDGGTTNYSVNLGNVAYGTNVTVEAIPNEGYSFTSWSVTDSSGVVSQTTNPNVFAMPANDVDLVANFELIPVVTPMPTPVPLPVPTLAPSIPNYTVSKKKEKRGPLVTAVPTKTPVVTETPEPVDNASYDMGYISGYPDNSFRPDNDISRAEVLTMLFRLSNDPNKNNKNLINNKFDDIDSDAWYAPYVNYFIEKGIATGYEDGTFKPDTPITRAEFATLISKLTFSVITENVDYPDVEKTFWGYNFISIVSSNGWMSGYPDGNFAPNKNITRAETVTAINKYLNNNAKPPIIPESLPRHFSDVLETSWAYKEIYEAVYGHKTLK